MHVSRSTLEDMPSDVIDRMEQFAARGEANQQTWGDLADSIVKKLKAAGFRQHNLYGQRGGFWLMLQDDGVLVGWSTTEQTVDVVTPFEQMVESAVGSAIEVILLATGFTARTIPQDEDYGGSIRVTGWQGPADQ